MKHFRLVDNLMGWLTFAIAAFVYCSTVEPTASFWDCPEFITTAYKLEVGHPPGAPFFMLTGNLFTQLVDDPTQVALMVNIMSALMSAACILFLFWTISHFARRLLCPGGEVSSLGRLIAIEASAMVGALAYTFSDTFWFSAVEGEVYAYSSLFTALVVWLMLKWEDHADEPHSDRWLVLIAYLTGLSIGVHLLNLLCLPALVLIYYYRRYPNANLLGSLVALGGSVVLVAAVLYGIVPGIVKVGGWFELLFVNQLHCPFNTGLIVYLVCLVLVVLWAVWETYRARHRVLMDISFLLSVAMLGIPFYGYGWGAIGVGILVLGLLLVVLLIKRGGKYLVGSRLMNTTLLCMLLIMVGYSSYAVIVIRSMANTPMDQNSPEDIFTLGSYLSREQYGDRPLFYGPSYNSQVALRTEDGYCIPVSKQGAPVYQRKEKASPTDRDEYEILRYDIDYVYAQNMLFPRMYSDRHKGAYEDWMGGVRGHEIPFDRCGEPMMVKMPTQIENMRFFFSYQLNFMYWRYFMWNFAGRQNDIQGNGEREHGNWITGFSWFDDLRLGKQADLPSDLRANKGHNVFYCLPLLLGLIGLFWQVMVNPSVQLVGSAVDPKKFPNGTKLDGIKQFWVVFFLFFMTGIAIVIYLNQTPMQPRERDYAYAGSFYAYAIWIGLGVAAIADMLNKVTRKDLVGGLLAIPCLLVPIQMASQTWDDHDRSGRYTCRDFGHNYLNSLQQKGFPIIYTNGDNDTFPLWYAQETEGFRTDSRVCNLSYLQTDWYIDQMKRPAYDSPAVPISWTRLQYVSGTREGVQVQPGTLEQVMEYYKDDPQTLRELVGDNPYELRTIIDKWILNENPDFQFIPTDSIVVTVDKEAVKRSGMMMAGDSIPDVMHISLKGKRAIYKSELMMLEMLASCNWERPLYVAVTVGADNYGDLGKNFVQEGLAYRITPFDTRATGRLVDSEKMYDNLMHRFRFGGLKEKPDVYLDETVMRMCYTHRRMFSILAKQLLAEGQKKKATEVLQKAEQELPETVVPHCWMSGSSDIAATYFALGKKEKAEHICQQLGDNAVEYLKWYTGQTNHYIEINSREIRYKLGELDEVRMVLEENGSPLADKYTKAMEEYYIRFQTAMQATQASL